MAGVNDSSVPTVTGPFSVEAIQPLSLGASHWMMWGSFRPSASIHEAVARASNFFSTVGRVRCVGTGVIVWVETGSVIAATGPQAKLEAGLTPAGHAYLKSLHAVGANEG